MIEQVNTHSRSVRKPASAALLCALALMTPVLLATLGGCSGAGQSEVTQSDRPSEGEGWAVQEEMAR